MDYLVYFNYLHFVVKIVKVHNVLGISCSLLVKNNYEAHVKNKYQDKWGQAQMIMTRSVS